MRDIKFRAFTGSEMVYDVMCGKFGAFYVNPTNNGLDENDAASLSNFNTKYDADIPIMQFTGLHDKNGTEIYEGDVDATGIEIKWDGIAASFICVRDGNFVGHLGEVSSLLLITGNIHECRT